MLAKTHVLTTMPFAYAIYSTIPIVEAGIMIGGLFIGVLLPDIDEKESYISRRLFFLFWLVAILRLGLRTILMVVYFVNRNYWLKTYNICRHRGITHFLVFPLSLFLLSLAAEPLLGFFLAGLSIGWLLHELGDGCTYGGVENWLFPFFVTFRLWTIPSYLRFRTNSKTEHNIILALVCIYLLYILAPFVNLIF